MSDINDILCKPAEEFTNNSEIETAWVIKASQHMEVYYNLITSADPKLLQLTKHDSDIYKEFRSHFPDFKVDFVEEETLKSKEAKEKWRDYCEKFKHMDDYNYGTILRLNSSGEYNNENTIFVPRIQFYAIEIARNKEGHNDHLKRQKTLNAKECVDLLEKTFHFLQEISQQCGFNVSVKRNTQLAYDLALFIKKTPNQTHNQDCADSFAETIKRESRNCAVPLIGCVVCPNSNFRKLELSLDRSVVVGWCLNAIQSGDYGCQKGSSRSSLVLSSGKKNLRPYLLSQLLSNLLRANGSKVQFGKVDSKSFSCLHDPLQSLDLYFKAISKDLSPSSSLKVNLNCQVTGICSNVTLQRIPSVTVKSGQCYTDIFRQAVSFCHLVDYHIDQIDTVYFVTDHVNFYKIQQVAQLWNQLYKINKKKLLNYFILVHGPLVYGQKSADYETCFGLMREAVKSSASLKYGFDISENASRQEQFGVLAETALRCNILSVSPASKVVFDPDARKGCFIQYNCARIAALLNRCPEAIKKDIFSKDTFDVTAVTQDEWWLICNYILTYPTLLKEVLDQRRMPLHRVCCMLSQASNDFSHYYARVKIFTVSSTRNSQVLKMRMKLLRGIQAVMTSGLSLLGVDWLPEM